MAEKVACLSKRDRQRWLSSLSDHETEQLLFNWHFWARRNQLAPPGDWSIWAIMAGRGFGKALALDTPLPTASGWTTMAAVRPGDRLFDERGQPCRVLAVHQVTLGRPCYRVKFSDGSAIVADEDHLWTTIDRRARKAMGRSRQPRDLPKTVTTAQIAGTLYDGKEVNHCIPCTRSLQAPNAMLPLDPYLLGCWLGDGSSAGAEITTADPEVVEAFEAAGYQLRKYSQSGTSRTYGIAHGMAENRRDAATGRFSAGTIGFRADLTALSVLGDKHIPRQYLRASIPQRLALLQGLLDTDGHCAAATGSVEFCSINGRLARDVRELALSLGYKAVQYDGRASLNGIDHGPKYRVCFSAHADVPLFRLKRKLAAQSLRGDQAERAYRRYIVAVEPAASVPVRCITVNSPSRLYLAGDAMVPTHNTRTGAEWVRQQMCGSTPLARGRIGHMALVAETAADARDVMVGYGKGPDEASGLLQVHPKDFRPVFVNNTRSVTWPNGAVATIYNGTEPDQLRGPQHGAAWCDELAKWRYAQDAWDQLEFGLRIGDNPQVCITTTPRPIKLLREILADPATVKTIGTTYENLGNLSPKFIKRVLEKYEGTRLGRQELSAEILDDAPGALWTRANIDQTRIKPHEVPDLTRIVVAIDPAVTSNEDSDETGIIAAGIASNGHGYIIEDASDIYKPHEWASEAISLLNAKKGDRIIAEVNNGGEMVEGTLRAIDPNMPYRAVHASRGKVIRAEPISAFYEQKRIHHVGAFPRLEDQMCAFTSDFDRKTSGYSPDRMDALVWALTDLMNSAPEVDLGGMISVPAPPRKLW